LNNGNVSTWLLGRLRKKKKIESLRDKKWGISCKVVADIRTTYVPTVITTGQVSNGTLHSLRAIRQYDCGGIMPITPPFDYDFQQEKLGNIGLPQPLRIFYRKERRILRPDANE
jgi:hypothetical protein